MRPQHPEEVEMKRSEPVLQVAVEVERELSEKGGPQGAHSSIWPRRSWKQTLPSTRCTSSFHIFCIPAHADTKHQIFGYGTLRTQISNTQNKQIHIFSGKYDHEFFKLDEIPQISTDWKHNAAFNFRHKTGLPLLSGGQPCIPSFFSILTHLFSMYQPPLLLLCETNSSFINDWGPQLPPLFQGTERREDNVAQERHLIRLVMACHCN